MSKALMNRMLQTIVTLTPFHVVIVYRHTFRVWIRGYRGNKIEAVRTQENRLLGLGLKQMRWLFEQAIISRNSMIIKRMLHLYLVVKAFHNRSYISIVQGGVNANIKICLILIHFPVICFDDNLFNFY